MPRRFRFFRGKPAQPPTLSHRRPRVRHIIRAQAEEHSALTRSLNQIRLREFKSLTQRGLSNEQAQAALAPFDQFATAFSDAGDELNGLVSDLNDEAMGLKEAIAKRDGMVAEAERLPRAGQSQAAAQIVVPAGQPGGDNRDLARERTDFSPNEFDGGGQTGGLLNNAPRLTSPAVEKQFLHWKNQVRTFVATLPGVYQQLENWDPTRPVPWYRGITAFCLDAIGSRPVFGRIGTASGHCWLARSWSRWSRLLRGPIGVASAIYVSEIAARGEKRLIKPYIEFIAAIPSVVLDFSASPSLGKRFAPPRNRTG